MDWSMVSASKDFNNEVGSERILDIRAKSTFSWAGQVFGSVSLNYTLKMFQEIF